MGIGFVIGAIRAIDTPIFQPPAMQPLLAPCRNCEPFSLIEDVAAAQAKSPSSTECIIRTTEQRATLGCLVLTSPPMNPFVDHAVDRIQRRCTRNLFAHYIRELITFS